MLSRIAESLFWIGRYVERADGTARILRSGRSEAWRGCLRERAVHPLPRRQWPCSLIAATAFRTDFALRSALTRRSGSRIATTVRGLPD